MRNQLRHRYKHRYQRGAALVEFALVTSAGFIVVLFAVFELGRLLFIFNTANEATRLGARLATVCDANATLITQRMSQLLPQLNASTVSLQYDPPYCAADDSIGQTGDDGKYLYTAAKFFSRDPLVCNNDDKRSDG